MLAGSITRYELRTVLLRRLFRSISHLALLLILVGVWGRPEVSSAQSSQLVMWGDNGYGQMNVPPGLSNVLAVACGAYHSLALRADGSVAAWGRNDNNQTNVPPSLSVARFIAVGDYHNLVVRSNGTVAAWGWNSDGQTNVPPGLSNVAAAAGGPYHSLVLRRDGSMVAWGRNNNGQTNIPTGLSNVVAISAGADHNVALRADGTVFAWGLNTSGQTNVPAGLDKVVAISSVGTHTLALRENGLVAAWGTHWNGFSEDSITVPADLSNVVAIAAGHAADLALKSDSTVRGWGNNFYVDTTVPAGLTNISAIAAGGGHWLAVQGGGAPSLLMGLANRSIAGGQTVYFHMPVTGAWPLRYQWRFNGTELPGATNATLKLSNVQMAQGGFYSVSVSNAFGGVISDEAELTVIPLVITNQPSSQIGYFSCSARLEVGVAGIEPIQCQWRVNGTNLPGATQRTLTLTNLQLDQAGIYSAALSNALLVVTSAPARLDVQVMAAWGVNNFGQTNVPTALTNIAALAGGDFCNLALRRDGTVHAWGRGDSGQTNVPAGLSNVIAMVGGGSHNLALRADGTVAVWGSGPTNPPAGLTNVVAIAAGSGHDLALRRDGTVVAWGNSFNGQTNVPLGLSNVIAVAAGYNHSLAVKADGSVAAWGLNDRGQTGMAGLSNVVAVAGGYAHSVALQRDGTVVVRGDDYYNQKNVPAGLSNVVAIATKGYSTLALRADGIVFAWGGDSPPLNSVPVGVSNVVSVTAGYAHNAALIGHGPPFILNGLADRTIHAGSDVCFQALANGVGPLNFQWQYNGGTLPGATNSLLVLTNVQPTQAGLYNLTVSNALGVATSALARLTVVPMIVTAQPRSRVSYQSGSVTFDLGIQTSTSLSYQWRFNGVNLTDATNATLVLTNLQTNQSGIYSVVVSNIYGMVVSEDARLDVGYVAAWGSNSFGQTNVPANLIGPRMVAGGSVHSLALQADGTVATWGWSGVALTNVLLGLSNVVNIAGGGDHAVAVRADGTVVAWGANSFGETNVPPGLTNVLAVESGNNHTLGLKSDGTLAAWGNNSSYNQATVPGGISNVIAFSTRANHNLAVCADGTVVAWGWNEYGQTNVPAGLSNVIAVAAGNKHSLALRSDGTVVGWGGSAATPPSSLSNVVAISAGTDASLALRADGTVYGWRWIDDDNGAGIVPLGLTGVRHIASGARHSLALIGNGPPSLLTPLPDRLIPVGGKVFFHAAATGDGTLHYQWRFNGADLPGDTNAVLILTNTQTNQAGFYSVSISNMLGVITSRDARLTVVPFTITAHPVDQSIYVRSSATFSVSVNGLGPFNYKWLFKGEELVGETGPVLMLTDVQVGQAGLYSVRVGNTSGELTSTTAALVVSTVAGDYVPEGLTNIVAIAAGEDHGLGLRADGTIVGWGNNNSGQASSPVGLSNVVAVAGAGYSSLALRTDTTVAAWGYAGHGQTEVPAGLSNVVAIAGGDYHSLALRADGTVAAWGWNTSGQVTVPANLSNVVAIAAGDEHSLALRADGTVVGWGRNNYSQLSVPGGLSNAVAIAAGGDHSMALRADGTVLGWGDSPYGNRNFPTWLSNAVAIADLDVYSMGLRADGTSWKWGYYYSPYIYAAGPSNTVAIAAGHDVVTSLLGHGAPYLRSSLANRAALVGGTVYFQAAASGARPASHQWRRGGVDVPGATNAVLVLTNVQPAQAGLYSLRVSNAWGVAIGAESQLTVLPLIVKSLSQNQRVLVGGNTTLNVVAGETGPFTYQWRFNGNDLAGATDSALPLNNVQLEQAGNYSVAVDNAFGSITSAPVVLDVSMLAAWGNGAYGQTNIPAGLGQIIATAGSGNHTLALRADGTVSAWGDNSYGQINVPAGLNSVISLAGALKHSLALRNDGMVVAWGDNSYGQTNVPAGLTNALALAGGDSFSAALRDNGTVTAWGSSSYTGVPAGLSNVVGIACGAAHTLALRANGVVVGWGNNSWGQISVPSTLSNVIAIAAGSFHSLALCADGTVVGWGRYDYGQSYVPGGLSNVVAVAGGGEHSFALCADGTLVTWGRNNYGQGTPPAGVSNIVGIAAGNWHSLAMLASGAAFPLSPLADRTAIAGRRMNFNAPASGRRPLSYQWRFNGSDLPGATNALLTLDNVQLNQAGLYSVVTSNSYGTITGREAKLTVLPLLVTAPLQSQISYVGVTTTFSFGVDGDVPIAYQWSFNGAALPGATDSNLVLNNLQLGQAGLYTVVASNTYGMLTSQVASLEVKTIAGWGRNNYGQTNAPLNLTNVVAIAGAERHSLALRADGTVTGWGDNTVGQLNVPVGLSNVRTIAAGNYFSYGISTGGLVTAWGYGSRTNLPAELTNAVVISVGDSHTLALRPDGRVFAWGNNLYGQTNVPVDLTNIVAVAAGGTHSLVLRSDGTLVAWGNNSFSLNTVPAAATNVVAISAGTVHNLALRADGSAIAWGNNSAGQASVPSSASNLIAIASGSRHNVAVRGDGVAVSWGAYDNDSGSSTSMVVPGWLSNVVSVAGGYSHSLALAGDGGPFVIDRLADRIIPVGGTTFFYATTSGKRPLDYRWRLGGNDLPDATNSVCILTNVQPAQSGLYSLAVSNAAGFSVSESVRLTVVPLIITTNPTSRTVAAGLNTTFTVGVMGQGPHSYQWLFNGDLLPGATNSSLTLTNLQLNQAGSYSVTVSNTWGAVSSGNAQLTVPPFIFPNPTANQTTNVGCTAVFAVAPSGTGPFTYQWRFGNVDITDATNATLRLVNVQPSQAGVYAAVVNNAYGTLTNAPAVLNVTPVVEWGFAYPGLPVVPTNLANVMAIAIGLDHSIGLRRNGTVAAWGSNIYGQTNLPATLTNVTGIAAGGYFSLAVRSNGTVAAWGRNEYGQTNLPAGLTNVIAVSAGGYHSLALRMDGTITAWGRNTYNQATVPAGLSNVVAVAGGGQHSLALRADGTVVGWGYNASSQANVPANLTNVVAIAAGDAHSLALKSDGRVIAWGNSSYGLTNVPATLSNVVAIAAGASFNVALRKDGTVVPWGISGNGITNVPAGLTNLAAIAAAGTRTLGLGGSESPVLTSSLAPRKASALGRAHFYAAAAGAKPLSFQWRSYGTNLPGATNGVLVLNDLLPAQTGPYSLFLSNTFGTFTSGNVSFDVGEIFAWGSYFTGTSNGPAIAPLGLKNVIALASGEDHGLALRVDRTIAAWGNNQYTQTGVPLAVQSRVAAVAAGGNHNLVLLTNGTVNAWGRNNLGQTSTPAGLSNVVAVAAGHEHSLALCDDGTVKAWGSSAQGQTNVPADLTEVVAIAGGGSHSLALRADGKVAAWGAASQTNVPPNLSDIVAIAAGLQHSLALRGDGRVFAWGAGSQTNVLPWLSNIVAIAAGEQHNLGLRSDGRVFAWGTNILGQTNVPQLLSGVVAIAAGADQGLALLGRGQPVITVQPFRFALAPAGQVQLRVMAVGNEPLTYQWQRDGVNLPGATNSSLILEGDAITGNYRVVVSNTLGITASTASLVTSLPVFELNQGVFAPDGFHLHLLGLSGRNHVVIYATTNLTDWWPIHTNPPVVGVLHYVDGGAVNQSMRFYRAAESDLQLGPLRLDATSQSPGVLALTVRGLTGLGQVVLLTSTNLLDWQPFATNQPVIGRWEYHAAGNTNSPPMRFYRALELR